MSPRRKEPETRKEVERAIRDILGEKGRVLQSLSDAMVQQDELELALSLNRDAKNRLEKCHFPGCHSDIIFALDELDIHKEFISEGLDSCKNKIKEGHSELININMLLLECENKRALLLRPWEFSRPRSERSLSAWGAV